MKVIIQGIATEYTDEGNGPIALFLHGWKDNLHTFDSIASSLSSEFRIIRTDLPGFGASEQPPNPWNLDDYVRFVKDFLAKISAKPDILIGHSFGGRITIKGVATKILNPKKVILISAAGVARRKTFKNLILAALAKIGRVITSVPPFNFWKQKIRRKLYEAIGSDYFRAGELSGTFVKIVEEDLSALAERIKIPTLIIWGEKDATTPVGQGIRLNKLIKDSRLEVISNAGHFVHKERPKEVAELIQKFV